MKIDIHVHTKKTKAGDSEHRSVDKDRFCEIVKSTNVRIIAITNHNHFDFDQYNEFRAGMADSCHIWPGIELDVLESGRRAHLIVIVNPKNADEFNKRVNKLLENKTADNFTITLKETSDNFKDLDSIYIAHYHTKKPNLHDEDVNSLLELVPDKRRVLKEATNSISAGIYISHGHNSIYGSDIHDWNDYINIASSLPDLRLPVESYEQFCLLLEKDSATINTILNKKSKDSLQINPFSAAELINIDIYNDINIIFGSKGTGKTEILKALSKYYNSIGHKTNVYESNSQHLKDVYNLKGADLVVNVGDHGLEDCAEEFRAIREATEKNITSISSYVRHFSTQETNKISQKIKVKDFVKLDESVSERRFDEIKDILEEFNGFNEYLDANENLSEIIGAELLEELTDTLTKILQKLKESSETRLLDARSIAMFNSLIKVFLAEISKKTGQPEKPIKTGFHEYASNRIKIERVVNKILLNIGKKIEPIVEHIGSLGTKGDLHCQTNIQIQNGNITDGKYTAIKNVNKTPQKEVSRQLDTVSKHIYSTELFEKIADLNAIEGAETITSISELLLFHRHFTLNNQVYQPSNGESSMILLHNELKKDKEIFLIDEPEKSLGNDYINDVIVPVLKQHALLGKKVVIATHDANIAVRTLPYNSIYREHDLNGYYTYTGNPFSNNLVCTTGDKDHLDWKNISMKTLEGGREAFGERGKIYGKA